MSIEQISLLLLACIPLVLGIGCLLLIWKTYRTDKIIFLFDPWPGVIESFLGTINRKKWDRIAALVVGVPLIWGSTKMLILILGVM